MADGLGETVPVKLGGRRFLASRDELMSGRLRIVGEAPDLLPPTLTTPLPDQFRPKPATPPKHAPKDPGVSGAVRLIDGDTFDYGGKRYRLFGVDAPETQERVWVQDDVKGTFQDAESGHRYALVSGRDAAKRLMGFMAGKTVEVAPIEGLMAKGQRGRDRGIARLKIDGQDAGQWLVSEGLAIPVPTFSGTEYDTPSKEARKGRKGYWARGEGYFEDPYQWRKKRRREQAVP